MGEVTDSESVVVPRKTGGVIITQESGRRNTFPRQDGVYKMKAAMRSNDKQERPDVMPVTMDAPTSLESSVDDEAREAEADEPKAVTMQAMPSREEVLTHEMSHLPSRSWCSRCVRGKGRERPPSCGSARR